MELCVCHIHNRKLYVENMSRISNREVVLSCALRLYEAIENNNLDDVQDLVLRKGANPNIVLPDKGISSFHLAVGIETAAFSEEITKLFLRYGGDPNVRSYEGLTPVHVASIRGRSENLHFLLLAGGDPEALDDDCCSPMYYAHLEGHLSCAEHLQAFKSIYKRQFYVKRLLDQNNDTKTRPGDSKEINDLIFSNNYNVQVEECSDVSEEYERKLNTYGNVNHYAIGEEDENTFDEEKIGRICLGTISSTTFCKDKNVTNDSIEMPKDLSKFTPVANSTWIPCQSDDGIPKSWLASNSCFSDTNELKNCLEKKAADNEIEEIWSNLSSKTDDESKFLESCCDKECDKEEYNKIDQNGENNFNGCSIINEETFTRNSTPSNSPLLTHLTYDMSDWSPDALLTYNICDYSIISSDRSSPIQNESNTSGEPSNIYRSFSKSRFSVVSENFREQTKYVTYRRKGWLNINFVESTISSANCSESEDYFTVPEEVYQYTDEEEGVVLLEKRLPPVLHPNLSTISNNAPSKELDVEELEIKNSSSCSLSTCDTEHLRKEIYDAVSSGCCCPLGPITATTKRVYLRKIHKFKKSMKDKCTPQSSEKPISLIPKFSRELERTLANPQSLVQSKYIDIEQRMMAQFDGNHKLNRWREGGQKSSFNYLLLDPRVTCNLPLRWANDTTLAKGLSNEANYLYWRDFLCAIFYIGKGKRSRPYSHLYEAVNIWRTCNPENKLPKKVKHILDIWKQNLGVVCLHVFQNSIPVEAFTREAAMIDAIGLNNLKNERRGDYYGVISSLGFSQKREFGSFLLHRAMLIFLNDGERQIRPADID